MTLKKVIDRQMRYDKKKAAIFSLSIFVIVASLTAVVGEAAATPLSEKSAVHEQDSKHSTV